MTTQEITTLSKAGIYIRVNIAIERQRLLQMQYYSQDFL